MKRLFISGMARSGTSWLLKIFGCHPDALCLYEPFNLVNERQSLPDDLRFWNLLPKMRKLAEEGNPEQAVREFAKPLARFEQVRDRCLDRKPFFPQPADPTVMVIKEDFSGLLPVVGEFGRVLFIVRDPRAVLNSMWNHTHFGRNYGARSMAEKWAENCEEALKLQDQDPENYQVVRYEDLVQEPVGTSSELYAWFKDLPYSKEVLAFMKDSRSRHDANPYSVYKDPAQVEAAWRRELSGPMQDLVIKAASKSRGAGLYPEVFG